MEEDKIKEYLFQAVQSGKRETSDLATDILHKMEGVIDRIFTEKIKEYQDNADLKNQLKLLELQKEIKTQSDQAYAPIIIKTIVYTFISIICVAFIGFLTKLIW